MISIISMFLFGVFILGFYEVLVLPPLFRYGFRRKISIRCNATLLILLLFAVIYTLFACMLAGEDFLLMIRTMISILLVYILGTLIVRNNGKSTQEYNKYIFALAMGMLFHALLNVYESYKVGVWGVTVLIYDFWTKQLTLSTYESTLLVMASGVALYVLFLHKGYKKLIGVFIILAELQVSLTIGSRSTLAIMIIGMIGVLAYSLFTSDLKKKYRMRITVCLFIALVVAIAVYYSNFMGIKTYVKESFLFSRYSLRNSQDKGLFDLSSRVVYYDELLKELMEHPFGGIILSKGVSAHNTFLDIIRIAGIIPGVLFIVFVFKISKKLIRIVKMSGLMNKETLLVSITYFMIVLLFMVESVFSLNRSLVYGFFLCCGIIDELYMRKKTEILLKEERDRNENSSNNAVKT